MYNCSGTGEKLNGDQCFEKTSKVKSSNLKLEDIRIKVSNYLLALRPWSFSASFTPVALGAVLAYRTTWEFNFLIFILNLISVFCVHGAGNLINTYYDYVKGIDSSGRSDDRTLVDRRLTPNGVVNLAVFLYLLGFTGFMILNLCSPAKIQHLALIFFCGLSSKLYF
jgi:1,4-dihydroxy-2-naphthoate octaprenyltransferase, putative